jgi:hypothetical protein
MVTLHDGLRSIWKRQPTKDWNLEVFGEKDIAEPGTLTVKIRQNPDTDTLLAGCPILWKSWIQSEFTLSGTESEFAGSLYSIRNAIPTMDFNDWLPRPASHDIDGQNPQKGIWGQEALAIGGSQVPPRTKHRNTQQFRFEVYIGLNLIHQIDTLMQPPRLLTYPLDGGSFNKITWQWLGSNPQYSRLSKEGV